MKKLFYSLVILISLVFLWFKADFGSRVDQNILDTKEKQEILRFAVISDSENDDENLGKALAGARANNAEFVIGLGDWTKLGEQLDLKRAKGEFDQSGLEYYVTAGDRDLWSGRNDGQDAYTYFNFIFGKSTHVVNKGEISLIIVDNADIYRGISDIDWDILNTALSSNKKLKLVFSHKAPYHPQTTHIMGSEREAVAKQAQDYINLLEEKKVGGFFSGDIHFYAKFNSPNNVFKMNTIGSVNRERNFRGPSFAIIKVYDDYSWDSESVEI